MCGKVIQSSRPLRYAIVDGMNVRDSRVHNYPPRWNAAPSQELLVIRRNHKIGEVSLDPLRWGLIPYWCNDPKGGRKPINAKCETVRDLPTFRDAYRKRRCIVPVDGFFEWKAIKGQKAKQPYARYDRLAANYLAFVQKAAADSDLRLSNDIKLADLTVELSILEGEPVDARGKRLERGIGDVYLREGIDPFISVCFYSNRTVTLRSGSKSEMEVMQAAKLQLA
jgi:SOS response associated peptidase (SRAP)